MSEKRISLRFNLDNEPDRRAWAYLQQLPPNSKNRTIIETISAFSDGQTNITEVIRQTIKECLKDISVVQTAQHKAEEVLSVEESSLLDSLDDFLRG